MLKDAFDYFLWILIFAGVWCLFSFVNASISGWEKLARLYRQADQITGTTWRHQVVTMRWWFFSGTRPNITVNRTGLQLTVPLIQRIGHPPLFIPWSAIMVQERRPLYICKVVRITFPAEPSVWIEISPRLAKKIQTAIDSDWFPTESVPRRPSESN